MPLGPVFQAELIAAARSRRFFALRVLYGLILLDVVAAKYGDLVAVASGDGGTVTIGRLAAIGSQVFVAFAVLQGAVLLVLTPTLVAGAIADERRRQTLQDLLASPLSSWEIVVGKAAARLLRLGMLGALGLPILVLVGFLGGVDYGVVALVYGVTTSVTFFLASLAILCSVHARRTRDAIVLCHFWALLWLTVPTILVVSIPFWGPGWNQLGLLLRPAAEWVEASSPTALVRRYAQRRGAGQLGVACGWMVGLQVGAGVALLVAAAWRLRPVSRTADDSSRWVRRRRARAQPRRFGWQARRPACGDDPLLWKELHVGRMSAGRRAALVAVGLVAVILAVAGWADEYYGALDEAWRLGIWGSGPGQQSIRELLRSVHIGVMVLVLLGLGATAAVSITSEREGDTWTALGASPLDGAAVVRAKTLGALWHHRGVAFALGGCWALGLVAGSLHPVGVVLAAIELAVFAWFVATLGVAVSLRARDSNRALIATIGILLAWNVGTPILAGIVRAEGGDELNLIGCIPMVFSVSVFSLADLQNRHVAWIVPFLAFNLLVLVPYGIIAACLNARSIRRYDAIVGRPSRLRSDERPTRQAASA